VKIVVLKNRRKPNGSADQFFGKQEGIRRRERALLPKRQSFSDLLREQPAAGGPQKTTGRLAV
jgi:hypothetical protein